MLHTGGETGNSRGNTEGTTIIANYKICSGYHYKRCCTDLLQL